MSKKTDDDATLISEFLEGDEKAYRFLIERYKDDIFNVMHYYLGSRVSRDRAESLSQEVFLEVYNNVGNLEERWLFGIWLYQLAINISNIELARLRQGDNDAHPNPEDEMEYLFKRRADDLLTESFTKYRGKEFRELVFQAIELLPDELRIVLILRNIAKLTYENMAAILDMSEDMLKNRVFLSKIKLKKMLK